MASSPSGTWVMEWRSPADLNARRNNKTSSSRSSTNRIFAKCFSAEFPSPLIITTTPTRRKKCAAPAPDIQGQAAKIERLVGFLPIQLHLVPGLAGVKLESKEKDYYEKNYTHLEHPGGFSARLLLNPPKGKHAISGRLQ